MDQAKLLALQREIDELSQPTHPANPLKRETIRNNRPTETKMEEETCEIMKKEKKHKKEKMAPPEVQNSGAEDGSQAKMKKKKRRRQAKMVVKEEQQETEQEEKKKTKRKKHDGINISAVEVETKKKLLEQDVNQAETVTLKVEKLEKKKRKEKKIKDKSLHIEPVHTKKGNKEMQIGDENPPKKPKKKKDNIVFSSEAETEEIVKDKKKKKKLGIADAFVETKAKKKSKLVENGNHVEQETGVKEVKLKKKKEKRKTEGFEGELEETEIQRKKKRKIEDPKSSKKIKETFINSEMVAEEEETKAKAKKKKKSIEDDGMAQSEETKTKKRGKKRKVEEEELDQHITPTADPPKKKSKKTAKGNLDINTEAKAGEKKKKKVKKEKEDSQEVPQVDVVFLSAKSGNKDEVFVNQERRKALQMEIDKASQPDKHTGLGQWSTAQFDSSQQQQKFLRLMGGFKKGSQPAGTTSRGANMALGKDAQQQLQQGLLGEFERAQSRRMDFNNRGAGLGFTAPSNKKFSIDINASRSIRFDS